MTYSLTEPQVLPHQQGKEGGYMRIGRGGRGNWVKPSNNNNNTTTTSTNKTTSSSSTEPSTTPAPPKPQSQPQPQSTKYTSGRGGIGNAHTGERPMFFFDEELERIYSREGRTPPVYHIGRAGFGNRVGSVSSASCSSRSSSNGAVGGVGDHSAGAVLDDRHHRIARAEEVRMSEESRRSWTSASSDGSTGRRQSGENHHHHHAGGVWGRLSQTFARASS